MRMNSSPEHRKEVDRVLPKKTFVETRLLPALKKRMTTVLLSCLKAEIAVYKAFPKINNKFNPATFDPRNGRSCFMGQGFYANAQGALESWTDADLKEYRTKVGTIKHAVWGECTLLEIWAADHYDKYPAMVKAVHTYCYNKSKKLPRLKIEIMPLIANADSGKYLETKEDKEEEKAAKEVVDSWLNRGKKNKSHVDNDGDEED